MYFNARFYDPAIGRFITSDSEYGNGGTQGYNRFMYAAGNPIKYTDPTGHDFWDDVGDFFEDVGEFFEDVGEFLTNPIVVFFVVLGVVLWAVSAVAFVASWIAVATGEIGITTEILAGIAVYSIPGFLISLALAGIAAFARGLDTDVDYFSPR